MDATRNTKGHYCNYHSRSAVDVQKTRSVQEIPGTYIYTYIGDRDFFPFCKPYYVRTERDGRFSDPRLER